MGVADVMEIERLISDTLSNPLLVYHILSTLVFDLRIWAKSSDETLVPYFAVSAV